MKISVVIPAYNRADYIAPAIESVLNQKGSWDLDIVVVDDGSTDNTAEVVKKFKDKVRYYKIPHSGLPAVARNFGIQKSKGELIAFQDSDDLWAPDKLISQVALFDDPDVALTYGQAEVMAQDGHKTGIKLIPSNKLKQAETFDGLVKENVISTLTVIVRKDAFQAVGGFSESKNLQAVEDYNLWLRLAAKYPGRIKCLNKVLSYYRVHDQNISKADSLLAVSRLINVYNDVWFFEELSESQRKSLEKYLLDMHENWSRLNIESGNIPAISVVMGIYKDKPYVKQAVQSILDQTFKDFEFIIIDDGSNDGSAKIVSSFKDPRIRLIHQANHGLVDVLNTGVKLARSNLIARQDADDISLSKRFENEFKLMQKDSRLAVVGTFFRYIDYETLKPTGVTITSPTKSLDIIRGMYFDNPFGHGTVLMRKEAINEAGNYTDKYGPNEDYALWRAIVDKGWRVAIIPHVYYLYRISPTSISHSKAEVQHQLFAKLLDESWQGPLYGKSFREIIYDVQYYKNLKSPFRLKIEGQYKSHQIRLSREFLLHGHLREGYKNFVAALLIYPVGALSLWKTLFWAPIKYLKEHR